MANACAEPCCIALVAFGSIYCAVHVQGKELVTVIKGEKCTACHELLRVGQFVARESVPGMRRHVACPSKNRRTK